MAVNVIVTVDDEQPRPFDEVVKNLRKAGLQVDHALDSIGMVTGMVDEKDRAAVSKVRGVKCVEEATRKFASDE